MDGVVAACGSPSTPATPALGQWPPYDRGAPVGVELAVTNGGATVTLTNSSTASYWIQPDLGQVWYGGSPWVRSGETRSTGVALEPGTTVELPVEAVTSMPARVGVEVWDSRTPDPAHEEPWFVWAELPEPGS